MKAFRENDRQFLKQGLSLLLSLSKSEMAWCAGKQRGSNKSCLRYKEWRSIY